MGTSLNLFTLLFASASLQATVFNAADFGAKPDGYTVATPAIQKAIDAAASAGGGVVTFPRGTYMTGSLFLKSNVELRLDDGVTLRAVADDAAFPEIPSRSAGIEMPWPAAVINAIGQKNVKLTGSGIIDGNGSFWWLKFWGPDHKSAAYAEYERKGLIWALSWDCKRPQMVLFKDCEDAQIKDVTLLRSPFWTIQLTYCARVSVAGVTIRNNLGGFGPSTDGIDVDSSSDVLIENCDIDCNDDNICLKSGRDADGLRVNRPTERVVIRNCVTRSGHGMLTLGTETSGGIRHVEAYGIRALGTTTGIRFKGRVPRGGIVEAINIHDIVMEGVKNPIAIDLGIVQQYPVPPGTVMAEMPAHWRTLTQTVAPAEKGIPEFRDVQISNLQAFGAEQALAVRGHARRAIHHVRLENITIEAERPGTIQHAADWTMKNVTLRSREAQRLDIKESERVEVPTVAVMDGLHSAAFWTGTTLAVVDEQVGPLIGPGYPGTEDNLAGFETGCVVQQGDVSHLFVNEMFGLPHRNLRIAHWTSVAGQPWRRQSTIVHSIAGRSALNLRSEVWLTGVAFDELENRWNIFYVMYRGGDGAVGEIPGSDYAGKIWRAASTQPGRDGIGGPYDDVDIIMQPDAQSLPWEGQQGVDSFFPWRVGDRWYGFYGSHNHLPRGPWLVGLAESPTLAGPWRRVPAQSPSPLVKEFVENPVVLEIGHNRWITVYDSNAANAIGYSLSTDGIHWTPEKTLIVQGADNRWSGNNGLWDVRTPLGLLPKADGRYDLIYTAKLNGRAFWAIGKCTVRFVEPVRDAVSESK